MSEALAQTIKYFLIGVAILIVIAVVAIVTLMRLKMLAVDGLLKLSKG